ncbi:MULTISPECIES: ABC transporter permease [Bacillus]|uniref:ABC transporter permease n=1 Tax=Bacillus TaxID=1386 RepID=UPI00040AB112|nr:MULTISPECIES: ABC transporter permease [Bacillus]QHZ45227.1 ABC transporter permease [Bacillus sp. NSP9.1]WFA04978.1 ABC transporter permease [Bacillus sp. HSf4]
MKEMLWLVKNTLNVTFRKKINIFLFMILPLIGIFVSLLTGTDEQGDLRIGVVDHDKGEIAADTARFLKGIDDIKVVNVSKSKADSQIASGELDGAITFDQGFSQSVRGGKPGHIEIASVKGAEITGFVKSYLYHYIDNIAALGQSANGDQQFQTMYKNYQNSKVPLTAHKLEDSAQSKNMTDRTVGFLLMAMLFSAGSLTELLVKEKENRTYFRLLTTPITAKQYVLANIVVSMLVITFQVFFTLVMATYVFHIETGISFWEMAAVLLIFALSAVGLALITVVFANSSKAAGALKNLIFMPTIMLSGCFWPIEIMPSFVQKIADFLPQTWVLETLAKLQEGQHLHNLYLNILILFAFAAAFFLIVIYKFSRNNEARNFA